MECPNCHTLNTEHSNFCHHCGTSLAEHQPPNRKWILPWLSLLIVGMIVMVFHTPFLTFFQRDPASNISHLKLPESQIPPSDPSMDSSFLTESPNNESIEKKLNLTTGTLTIEDRTGKTLTMIVVPVVNGSWIALPTRHGIGGYVWRFTLPKNEKMYIVEGGIQNEGGKISLWQLEIDEPLSGPDLYPWNPEAPVTWQSLSLNVSSIPVGLTDCKEQGLVVECDSSKTLTFSGVFLQNNQVVGWTFGHMEKGNFLWVGDVGENLFYDIRLDDFYRVTFANGREEQFLVALAMEDDYSASEQLYAFLEGFRLDPTLSDIQTPAYLKKRTIIPHLRSLMSQAVQERSFREIADFFDAQVLVEAADIPFFIDVVRTTVKGYGYEYAILLAEETLSYLPTMDDNEARQLESFHSELYQNWIVSLLKTNDIQGGWRAFESAEAYFPNDPQVHLLGVALAVAQGDWATAETLLYSREYPSHLAENVKSLENRIAVLRSEENAIIIRFAPGSRNITVNALVGDTVSQKFVIDTGASLVTIPYSTAEALGIDLKGRVPRRIVLTAGGIRYAHEVILPVVELEGQRVYDVRAFVLDIPERPDWGLLGLNFLNRFRVDLNSEKGVLRLESR